MARIYVASSWRNPHQPNVVEVLRECGHEVYDFRNPFNGVKGFAWSEIDPDWQAWSAARYRELLTTHPIAARGFLSDLRGMQWADTCVLVLPCGRSAHLEAGWFCGQGQALHHPDPRRRGTGAYGSPRNRHLHIGERGHHRTVGPPASRLKFPAGGGVMAVLNFLRREPDLSGMVADLGSVVDEALTTPTPDAAKKHIAPAQVQFAWEIEDPEGGILVDEAKIMRLEGEIAGLRRSIAEKQAGIAERRKFKAIIDDAASKLEALNSVDLDPKPAKRRSRKAEKVEA